MVTGCATKLRAYIPVRVYWKCQALACLKIACNKTLETKFITSKRYFETTFNLNLSQHTMNVSARFPVTNYTSNVSDMVTTRNVVEQRLPNTFTKMNWQQNVRIQYMNRSIISNNNNRKTHRSFLISARYTVSESN